MSVRKSNKEKQDLAKVLYLAGAPQKEIANRVGVSEPTMTKWVNQNGWQELRAAKNITRPELINKLLLSINNLLEKANEKNGAGIDGLGDQLAKLASTLDKLDKKSNVVDVIDVFILFINWLETQIGHNPNVTLDLVKQINALQDTFVSSLMSTS